MGFQFRDLSITLTTGFNENKQAIAKLAVKTCGDPSLVMQYRTCETSTQQCSPTKPDDLRLRSTKGDPGDLKDLQKELAAILENFGPNGKVPKKARKEAKKKAAR